MIQVDEFSRWEQQYTLQVEKSINYYNELNLRQPVYIRKMTAKEYFDVFCQKKESCHRLKNKVKEM